MVNRCSRAEMVDIGKRRAMFPEVASAFASSRANVTVRVDAPERSGRVSPARRASACVRSQSGAYRSPLPLVSHQT